MKQIVVLLISLVFTSLTFAQSNSLQEGNNCFAKGDYACAIAKYKEVINLQDERRKKIAGDNLMQAEKCFELLRMADAAFSNKNFSKAKEYYLSIVNENPKDEYAKAQLNAIKIELITLRVSKNTILYFKSGGIETVYVTTDADSFSIGILPSWCTLQKFQKYFTINCTENLSDSERLGSFTISAGNKSQIINIRQSKEKENKLSVSRTNLSFNSSGGNSEKIFVSKNSPLYSISLLPYWCSVNTSTGYFILLCNSNYDTKSRSDSFKVMSGNEEVKIYVSQAAVESSITTIPDNVNHSPKTKSKYFFTNIGAVVNDPKIIDNLMVTMGGRKFYVRVKLNPKMIGKSDNYSTTYLSNELEITNAGRINNFPSASNSYYVVSDQLTSNRQSVTLGTSFGGETLRFYLGGGYGERLNLWGLNINSYSNNQTVGNFWAKNINQSWKGIEAESGFFLKLGHFNIMGGVSTIFDSKQNSPFFDFHLGLGFSTR
jgi:hypothetical protein